MLEASTSYQPANSRDPPPGMIAPSSFGDCSAVYDVWAETAQDAFVNITALLHRDSEVDYMIGIDSEFAIPDGVVSLGREPPSANVHYEELCKMVNGGNLVQVGFAVADANFNVLGVWQFNLQFQSSWRAPWHAGVAFLRDEAKLKLEEHASHGIPAAQFFYCLASSAMIRNPKITWISFMGYPDFGFLIRLLTRQEALPGDRFQFLNLFWELFPRSFDVRVFTKLGRCRKEVIHGGLAKVCETLQVERVGDAHHAGSDALLVVRCFHKMMTDSADFATQIPRYCGVLYGVGVDCW
ncbi:putative CCR4-associated factor 1-10-like protein [Panicum miliaceum]|uniref:CCR4-associated factor 1-10-like protein n=1 Tax=Panicum miliaceum TaxID=4540 RepID=A0A3L6R8F7_PANMI|nr:putative CCR4-associated factor 1-10-like protein [Panicum miliaceum]